METPDDAATLAALIVRLARAAGREAAQEEMAAARAVEAEQDQYLSPREAARRVRRRLASVFLAIRSGDLPAKRSPGAASGATAGRDRFLIKVADLRAWAAKP